MTLREIVVEKESRLPFFLELFWENGFNERAKKDFIELLAFPK